MSRSPGSSMTIERGSHSGSNFSLKSRSDWIWKNGLSALRDAALDPAADRRASSALVEQAAPGGEVEREALDARSRRGERGVGDQVLGQAVRGAGPAAHQVERVAGIARRSRARSAGSRRPGRSPLAGRVPIASTKSSSTPSTSWPSSIVKPRSSAPSRHSSLISLSSSTSGCEASVSLDQLEAVVLADPVDRPADGLHPAALEGELAAVEDRLVAEVERVHAALAVDRRRRPRGRRGTPRLQPCSAQKSRNSSRTSPVSSGGPIGSAATIA